MPVDRSANSTNIHFLMILDFSPTKFTMRDEGLILVDFLWRQIMKIDNFSIIFDEHDLFSAARTCWMVSPPSDKARHAKTMPTLKDTKFLLRVRKTYGTFVDIWLSYLDDLLHSPCHSWIDQRLSSLWTCIHHSCIFGPASFRHLSMTSGLSLSKIDLRFCVFAWIPAFHSLSLGSK